MTLYVTGFDALPDNKKKDAKTAGEEMLYAILYLENSYKARFAYLNNHAKKNCV